MEAIDAARKAIIMDKISRSITQDELLTLVRMAKVDPEDLRALAKREEDRRKREVETHVSQALEGLALIEPINPPALARAFRSHPRYVAIRASLIDLLEQLDYEVMTEEEADSLRRDARHYY